MVPAEVELPPFPVSIFHQAAFASEERAGGGGGRKTPRKDHRARCLAGSPGCVGKSPQRRALGGRGASLRPRPRALPAQAPERRFSHALLPPPAFASSSCPFPPSLSLSPLPPAASRLLPEASCLLCSSLGPSEMGAVRARFEANGGGVGVLVRAFGLPERHLFSRPRRSRLGLGWGARDMAPFERAEPGSLGRRT